jgi:hypothetical protein
LKGVGRGAHELSSREQRGSASADATIASFSTGEACASRGKFKLQIRDRSQEISSSRARCPPHHFLELPELAPYRTLRRHVEHQRERIFVAEGRRSRRLLESSFPVVSALLTEQWLEALWPALKARPEQIAVCGAQGRAGEVDGFPLFQGALASAEFRNRCPCP